MWLYPVVSINNAEPSNVECDRIFGRINLPLDVSSLHSWKQFELSNRQCWKRVIHILLWNAICLHIIEFQKKYYIGRKITVVMIHHVLFHYPNICLSFLIWIWSVDGSQKNEEDCSTIEIKSHLCVTQIVYCHWTFHIGHFWRLWFCDGSANECFHMSN